MKHPFFKSLFAVAAIVAALFIPDAKAVSVVGALSNFDLYNDTGTFCDEFELVISNVVPSQLYGTWNYNPHYGTPVVTDIGGATLVHYTGKSANITSPSSIEHFGVILPAFPTNGVLYTWMHAGTNVGVGRQFPGPVVTIIPVPPTPANPEGRGRHREVRNTDRTNTYWVQRLSSSTNRNVRLDELMSTNVVVIAATNVDDRPKILRPGDVLRDDDDGSTNEVESQVTSLQIFADNKGKPGHIIGNFMSSAQTIRRSHVEGIHREHDGRHTLDFRIEPATNYVVQASEDSLNWTNIGSITTNQPLAHFTDDDSTNHAARFYRLKQR